jgi:tripartite-type tricarboxylate transporter receptor subunit TctC
MLIYGGPHVVVVHPSFPARSIKELVAIAKSKPGKLDYASAGTGTVTFLATEIFKDQAGVDMTHVPYKGGGESLRSVLANETPIYFSPLQVALPHIREGRLVALAVTSKQRMPQLPDVPTVAESGYPSYEFSLWNGLLVPAATPKDRIEKIHASMVKVLAMPSVRKQLTDMGSVVAGDKPEEFRAFLKAEVETLRKLLTKLKVRAD